MADVIRRAASGVLSAIFGALLIVVFLWSLGACLGIVWVGLRMITG